jgi:hypothetical protein
MTSSNHAHAIFHAVRNCKIEGVYSSKKLAFQAAFHTPEDRFCYYTKCEYKTFTSEPAATLWVNADPWDRMADENSKRGVEAFDRDGEGKDGIQSDREADFVITTHKR